MENQNSNEQQIQNNMNSKKIINSPDVGLLATQFQMAAAEQDKLDAFNQMADDYFDGKKIDAIFESRRRDPLTNAIDERNDRVQAAMQQGSYVDQRDKDFMINTNIHQLDQAHRQEHAHDKIVDAEIKITEMNQEKSLQLEQAELEAISQLTGTDNYGIPRSQTSEDINAIREKIKLIQEIKQEANLDSQIKLPQSMSTEELMANQMDLQQLQQQLNQEYHNIGNKLINSQKPKAK